MIVNHHIILALMTTTSSWIPTNPLLTLCCRTARPEPLVTSIPTFTIDDDFQPDLDDTMLPYLLAEAKSTCFSLFKSGSDPKIEQSARRLKVIRTE